MESDGKYDNVAINKNRQRGYETDNLDCINPFGLVQLYTFFKEQLRLFFLVGFILLPKIQPPIEPERVPSCNVQTGAGKT